MSFDQLLDLLEKNNFDKLTECLHNDKSLATEFLNNYGNKFNMELTEYYFQNGWLSNPKNLLSILINPDRNIFKYLFEVAKHSPNKRMELWTWSCYTQQIER